MESQTETWAGISFGLLGQPQSALGSGGRVWWVRGWPPEGDLRFYLRLQSQGFAQRFFTWFQKWLRATIFIIICFSAQLRATHIARFRDPTDHLSALATISKPTLSRKREIEIFIMAFDRDSRFAKRCSWGPLGAQGPLGPWSPQGPHPMVPIGPR